MNNFFSAKKNFPIHCLLSQFLSRVFSFFFFFFGSFVSLRYIPNGFRHPYQPRKHSNTFEVTTPRHTISFLVVKSAYEPGGPSGRRLTPVSVELGISLHPPGWDASPSQDYPPALCSLVPIYTPEWRKAVWNKVSFLISKETTRR